MMETLLVMLSIAAVNVLLLFLVTLRSDRLDLEKLKRWERTQPL